MFYFDSHYLIYVGIPILIAMFAQFRVSAAFNKYARIRSSSGKTGSEVAREILQAAQIDDVEVTEVNGFLGDHYDPTKKRLCLSTATYNTPSLAAVGIAAHETGHAIQHARAYAPLQWRMTIVPITQIASNMLPFVIIGGLWFHMFALLKLGVLVYLVLTVFQLITLPVEYDASRRAKIILGQMGLVQPGAETAGVRDMLGAAALTYVAAFIASLGNLLWLLSMTSSRRD